MEKAAAAVIVDDLSKIQNADNHHMTARDDKLCFPLTAKTKWVVECPKWFSRLKGTLVRCLFVLLV